MEVDIEAPTETPALLSATGTRLIQRETVFLSFTRSFGIHDTERVTARGEFIHFEVFFFASDGLSDLISINLFNNCSMSRH